MLILPLKFIREEDKKAVGQNIYHLAKLGHLGLPVVESVVAIPPANLFEKVLNKYLKHNFVIKDHLNNIKAELLSIPAPETLESLSQMSFVGGNQSMAVSTKKLWQNLTEKWVYEIISKIERGEKQLFNLTPQLVVFSANFSALGSGFFDEDRKHVSIKVDKGEVNFNTSSEIENLILLGNKKLLLPQVYHWAIEDGRIKILKVLPFTQSHHQDKTEKIVSVDTQSKSAIKTATKILLDYQGEQLPFLNTDGAVVNITKIDPDKIDKDITKILSLDPASKIIFNPAEKFDYEKSLEYAKTFLFFRNKKKMDIQIILPETFSLDEFLNLKREYASLGIYSKGSLKIWKQFNTVSDFLNLDQYLDGGFDGAVIDLDNISKIVCGVDGETALKGARSDWLSAIEKFFKEMGLSKIIKANKLVLIKGKLAQNEELLNYFIKSGIWGIAFEGGTAENIREHISFLEKQAIRKLPRVEIQH